jgi:hypothetical protein
MVPIQRIALMAMAIALLTTLVIGSGLQLSYAHHRSGHSGGGPSVATLLAEEEEPNTKVRALQGGNSLSTDPGTEGVLGVDIDCVAGIEGTDSADTVVCYLVPDGIATPDYATSPIPPQSSNVGGACPDGVGFTSGFECFSMTFDESLFENGHWRFVAEFYKNGQLVDIKGSNVWTNHSFMVIPESPIGIAALVMSSLAALGGFMFLRGRKSNSMVNV